MNDDHQPTDTRALGEGLLGRVSRESHDSEESDRSESRAIKIIEHARAPDPDGFRRHFESLARLDHPHLIDYLGLDQKGPQMRLIGDYVEGTDLLSYIRRAPSVDEIQMLRRRDAEEAEAQQAVDSELGEPVEADSELAEGDPQAPAEATQADEAEAAAADEVDELTDDFPEVHTYTEGTLASESSDVVLDPPPTSEPEEVELIDIVFLRLERLMPQLLGALDYLHRFRTPHGDLKPTNILVDHSGRCVLSDYGLLAELEAVDRVDGALSPPPADEAMLTESYRPPEQSTHQEVTPEADLYALGCILFEAITGCRPIDTDAPDAKPEPDPEDSLPDVTPLEGLDSIDPETDAPPVDPTASEQPTGRHRLRPSALSEIEPRCPAAWVDLILRLLDPDPDERPDFEEIRRVLSSSQGRSVDIPPSFVPEQESYFGRDEILDRLIDEATECVARETLRMSLLAGSAGYGKTAMAERLGQWAAQRGWVILRGRCYDRESLIYQGWNEIAGQLDALCRRAMGELDEKTERVRRRAARLFPILADPDHEAGSIDRLEAVAALRRLLRLLSAERPILIIFDDLNWASWDTAALLADLVGEPEGIQCMVVGTWRDNEGDEEAHRLTDDISTAPVDVSSIEVRGFRPDEAEAYVDSVADLSPDLRSRVLKFGGENPLLLEELIYQLYLQRQESSSGSGGDNSSGHLAPPVELFDNPDAPAADKLTRLVRHRLDSLTRQQMFVIQILSVASLPLPDSIISLVLDEEFHSGERMDDSVGLLLDRLRTLRLVRQVDTNRWDRAYTLFHNISRTLVLDEIHEQHYTHLCEHIANALRRLWPEAHELRFEYLLRADQISEALDTAVRTAQTAEERFAYHRTAKHWRWIEEQSAQTGRMTSLQPREELARVEHLAGRPAESAPIYRELADALPVGVARSNHRLREFETVLASGERPAALEALEGALEAVGERYTTSSVIQKFSELKNRAVAAMNRWSEELDDAEHQPLGGTDSLRLKLFRHIILKNDILDSRRGARFRSKFSALAERSKDALLLAYERLFLARDCHTIGLDERPERAEEWYDEAEALFERAGDPVGEAHLAIGRARLRRNRGQFGAADRCLDRASSRLGRCPDIEERERYLVAAERAEVEAQRGNLARAIRRASALRHLHRGNQLAVFRANQVLLPTHLLRGEIDRAELLIEQCQSFLGEDPPCVATVWLARQTVRLNLALGRPEVARGQLDVLDEQLHRNGLIHHPYVEVVFPLSRAQALIALLTRKQHIGESRRRSLRRRIQTDVAAVRNRDHRLAPWLESEAERLLARGALLNDDLDTAYDHLQVATNWLSSYPNPVARSMCAEATGLIFRRSDPNQGTSLLEQSRIVYDHADCHFPLVLEGWPVPKPLASLQPDEQ